MMNISNLMEYLPSISTEITEITEIIDVKYLSKNFWDTLSIIECILNHCQKHRIIVWPLYSTYNLINNRLFDITNQEINFGIYIEDRNKFIDTFKKKSGKSVVLNTDYYDNINMAVYQALNSSNIVNIIIYDKFGSNNKKIISNITDNNITDNNTTDNNTTNYDTFCYPLETKLFLGQLYYVPTSWSPLININQNISTISKFTLSKPILQLKYYDFSREIPETFNVPLIIENSDNKHDFNCNLGLNMIPRTAHFRVDLYCSNNFIKLSKGNAVWWCVAPEDYAYLQQKGHTLYTLVKLKFSEIIRLESNYLFGKIYSGIVQYGDTIWFPKNTLYKMINIDKSYKFGDYLDYLDYLDY